MVALVYPGQDRRKSKQNQQNIVIMWDCLKESTNMMHSMVIDE